MKKIDDLLIEYDEMGMCPTTVCDNPIQYANEWRKDIKLEFDRLNTTIQKLRGEMTATKKSLNAKMKETKANQRTIEKLKSEIARLTAENERLRAELTQLNSKKDTCANSVDEMIKQCDNCELSECIGCEHSYTAVQELKSRLENAVELPCKVGDTVYWIEYEEVINEDVGIELTPYIETGILLRILIEKDKIVFFTSRDKYWEHAFFNEKEYNKNWFTDRTKAEAHLAELKGGKE